MTSSGIALHIQLRLEAFWVVSRTLGVRIATQKHSVEPERRIELLTYALRMQENEMLRNVWKR